MNMKKYAAIVLSTLIIGVGSAGAQMMGDEPEGVQGSGQEKQMLQSEDDDDYMMYPGMMGGYGMGQGMMGDYGMGAGMMGRYGMRRPYRGMGRYGCGPDIGRFSSPKQCDKFLNDTKELRKKMHDMQFEYGEMLRNPSTTMGDLKKMQEEMYELQQKIREQAKEY